MGLDLAGGDFIPAADASQQNGEAPLAGGPDPVDMVWKT